jgi:hypothetical protein
MLPPADSALGSPAAAPEAATRKAAAAIAAQLIADEGDTAPERGRGTEGDGWIGLTDHRRI